eukprot:1572865-Rhodomonas_salina.2
MLVRHRARDQAVTQQPGPPSLGEDFGPPGSDKKVLIGFKESEAAEHLSMLTHVQAPSATTLAARGWFWIRASSPK